ncbi:unnamed protein product [Polarella glacialis]|uniref:FH2 domain-containing protein n=1 Tax=Polarella glacialis TaxID=89957 RepID=A0A813LI82_POLGL|nr:unnamed protein product [Polarella glacialis]
MVFGSLHGESSHLFASTPSANSSCDSGDSPVDGGPRDETSLLGGRKAPRRWPRLPTPPRAVVSHGGCLPFRAGYALPTESLRRLRLRPSRSSSLRRLRSCFGGCCNGGFEDAPVPSHDRWEEEKQQQAQLKARLSLAGLLHGGFWEEPVLGNSQERSRQQQPMFPDHSGLLTSEADEHSVPRSPTAPLVVEKSLDVVTQLLPGKQLMGKQWMGKPTCAPAKPGLGRSDVEHQQQEDKKKQHEQQDDSGHERRMLDCSEVKDSVPLDAGEAAHGECSTPGHRISVSTSLPATPGHLDLAPPSEPRPEVPEVQQQQQRRPQVRGKGPPPPPKAKAKAKAMAMPPPPTGIPCGGQSLPGWMGPRPPEHWKAERVVNWQPIRNAQRWQGSVWEQVHSRMLQEGFQPLPEEVLIRAFGGSRAAGCGTGRSQSEQRSRKPMPSATPRQLPPKLALTADLLHAQLLRAGVQGPEQLGWLLGSQCHRIAGSDAEATENHTDHANHKVEINNSFKGEEQTVQVIEALLSFVSVGMSIEPTLLGGMCGTEKADMCFSDSQAAPAELFLARLRSACGCPLQDLKTRIELVLHMATFPREAAVLGNQLQLGLDAIQAVLKSEAMPLLLEGVLLLGNYVNSASKSLGGAVGVSLESLAKLAHTRCVKQEPPRGCQDSRRQARHVSRLLPQENALHLLVQQLQLQGCPDLSEKLVADLEGCARVRDIDQLDLATSLRSLSSQVGALEKCAQHVSEQPENTPPALSSARLQHFFSMAMPEITRLGKLLGHLEEAVAAMRQHFAEPPGTALSEMFRNLIALHSALPRSALPVALPAFPRPCQLRHVDQHSLKAPSASRAQRPQVEASVQASSTPVKRAASVPPKSSADPGGQLHGTALLGMLRARAKSCPQLLDDTWNVQEVQMPSKKQFKNAAALASDLERAASLEGRHTSSSREAQCSAVCADVLDNAQIEASNGGGVENHDHQQLAVICMATEDELKGDKTLPERGSHRDEQNEHLDQAWNRIRPGSELEVAKEELDGLPLYDDCVRWQPHEEENNLESRHIQTHGGAKNMKTTNTDEEYLSQAVEAATDDVQDADLAETGQAPEECTTSEDEVGGKDEGRAVMSESRKQPEESEKLQNNKMQQQESTQGDEANEQQQEATGGKHQNCHAAPPVVEQPFVQTAMRPLPPPPQSLRQGITQPQAPSRAHRRPPSSQPQNPGSSSARVAGEAEGVAPLGPLPLPPAATATPPRPVSLPAASSAAR